MTRVPKCSTSFFQQQLAKFNEPDLHPLGHRIIEACRNHASVGTYIELMAGGSS